MLVQTCRLQNLKVHGPRCVIYTRGRIPIDRYGAEITQTCSHHRKLWNGVLANTSLTGITLQQFSTCSTSHYYRQVSIARQVHQDELVQQHISAPNAQTDMPLTESETT